MLTFTPFYFSSFQTRTASLRESIVWPSDWHPLRPDLFAEQTTFHLLPW